MKYSFALVLIAMLLEGCSPGARDLPIDPDTLEMEVLNAALPSLLGDDESCTIMPLPDEALEDYKDRLELFNAEIDSAGRWIKIWGELWGIDTAHVDSYARRGPHEAAASLMNAPSEDRVIDSSLIDDVDGVRMWLVREVGEDESGLSNSVGFSFSRVGFNSNFTRAAFMYFRDDGSCTGGISGLVYVALNDGTWERLN